MLGAETAEFVEGAGCPATSSSVGAEPPAAFSPPKSADAPPPNPEAGCDHVYKCVRMRAYQVSAEFVLLPYSIWIIVYMGSSMVTQIHMAVRHRHVCAHARMHMHTHKH